MGRDWHSLWWWYRGERPWRIAIPFALANVLSWLTGYQPIGTVTTLILIAIGPAIFWFPLYIVRPNTDDPFDLGAILRGDWDG